MHLNEQRQRLHLRSVVRPPSRCCQLQWHREQRRQSRCAHSWRRVQRMLHLRTAPVLAFVPPVDHRLLCACVSFPSRGGESEGGRGERVSSVDCCWCRLSRVRVVCLSCAVAVVAVVCVRLLCLLRGGEQREHTRAKEHSKTSGCGRSMSMIRLLD